MNNEKPYIEYNDNKYEFEASFTLKRQFDKEIKETTQTLLINNNIDEKQVHKIEKLKKFIEENPNLNVENMDEQTKSEILSLSGLVSKLDLTSIYEKYCYLMLKEKYDISKNEFEKMLEGLAEDYGYEFINTFVFKVCEKVFTQVGEKKTKKTLPSWMNK